MHTYPSSVHPLDPRFAQTKFVVEATDFERYTLQEKYRRTWAWRDHDGLLVSLAAADGRIINFAVFWVTLGYDGLVLFWHPVSALVDHTLIDTWFEQHCWPQHNGSRASCDPMSFHFCLQALGLDPAQHAEPDLHARLGNCNNPTCGKAFLRKRSDQVYCSPRCLNTVKHRSLRKRKRGLT